MTSNRSAARTVPTPVRQILGATVTAVVVLAAAVVLPISTPLVAGTAGVLSWLEYRRGRRSPWLATSILCGALLLLSLVVVVLGSSGDVDMTSTTSSTSSTH